MVEVWHGYQISKFDTLFEAAQFGYNVDGVLVWGDWPYCRTANPKTVLSIYN